MGQSSFDPLPDELLEAIVLHLPPENTVALGLTCKRANKIAFEHLVWRRHCLQRWRYWEQRHEIEEKQQLPPAQTKWRRLYNERRHRDMEALKMFDSLLTTQQCRVERSEDITSKGYDVKDMLLKVRNETPDDAEDVLARRFYANVLLGRIHRMTALEKWKRLSQQQMVRLEEVLGAYDLFVLGGRQGDLGEMDAKLDNLAEAVRSRADHFNELSTRRKAVMVAEYLRSEELVGNPNEDEYHALRNNFISIALFDDLHSSLPLQSVAIYCAVARRLGVNAKPSNYPNHVHAVIEAPRESTLDGGPRPSEPIIEGCQPELMHMDPWRSSEEVPREQLTRRLVQMGIPRDQHHEHLSAATMLDMALRTGRNIMNSVQETRDRVRPSGSLPAYPDVEAAWYGILWSLMMIAEPSRTNAPAYAHRRKQCLPYIVQHFQIYFPEDLGLIEKYVRPMFEGERELRMLLQLITTLRAADRNAQAQSRRASNDATAKVKYRIGHHFQHKRYGYEGFIIGWDIHCSADPGWMRDMRVDELPGGSEQPFYNIVAEDKSVRYVAEENIHPLHLRPCESLMALAGRYFKRWDEEHSVFVSNLRDEYPDD